MLQRSVRARFRAPNSRGALRIQASSNDGVNRPLKPRRKRGGQETTVCDSRIFMVTVLLVLRDAATARRRDGARAAGTGDGALVCVGSREDAAFLVETREART